MDIDKPNHSWLIAYKRQQRQTEDRVDRLGHQIQFNLTFDQWCAAWLESGKWDTRGTKRGSYCMSRRDDLGHYEVGNIEIKLASDNVREAARRKKGVSMSLAQREVYKGLKHVRTNCSCTTCGRTMNTNNLKRHFVAKHEWSLSC